MFTCSRCKRDNLKFNDFYARGNKSKGKYAYCKKCFNRYKMLHWIKCKIKAVEYLGGKCHCGFSGHPILFDFHHRDPQAKEFDWTILRKKSWELITNELDKCDLICCMCHRLRHADKTQWVECGEPLPNHSLPPLQVGQESGPSSVSDVQNGHPPT